DGDGTLERGPGEPLRARTALGPAAAPARSLASIAVVTDVHVRDEESPARPAFLDRLGPPFSATFRPHEALTLQVLGAAVRSIDAARPDGVVVNGDLIDNAQVNELAQARRVLDGGIVRPDSGAPGYAGVQRASTPAPAYYRPDVDPPREPGLLARAQRPFRSAGLRAPWYPVAGNHDLLVAGELARTARTDALARGDRMLVEPDAALRVPRGEAGLSAALVDRLLDGGLPGRTARVAADSARRQLTPRQAVAGLRAGTGARLDYVFDAGPRVRAIVLDTVRRTKGAGGVVTAREVAFLRRELRRAGDRWVLVFTHHPLERLDRGARLRRLLDREPRVLAAIAGDTHRNRVAPRRTAAGGYWRITTSALADFPQQARMLRVAETRGGGAMIDTWMLDTAPDPLADTARALAFLDAQGGRPDGNAGGRLDRNVRLYRAPPAGP
ncbi:MAG TPA: metallophosphoesterase, partial [Solirubrobacteraceae bacterium]|nr:metallophosphoesterase [Solirubrobacteraceae bacterium]